MDHVSGVDVCVRLVDDGDIVHVDSVPLCIQVIAGL